LVNIVRFIKRSKEKELDVCIEGKKDKFSISIFSNKKRC
jgi:hypothetical protein